MTANGIKKYLRRLVTQWVAVDPDPQPSHLDRMDGVR